MHRSSRNLLTLFILLNSVVALSQTNQIGSLKVTILSTMLADKGIGEWGFCALVEFDGKKILFDTGARPETVFNNATELKIDLSDVKEVFISHGHGDHTGGLLTLRNKLLTKNPSALSVVHVGEGAFYARDVDFAASLKNLRLEYENTGGKFIIYSQPKQLYPGVWITGPVPRKNDERNWNVGGKVTTPKGEVIEDNVPEDQSLVFNTKDGLIILSGCGHSGVINTIEYARQVVSPVPVGTLIGGFHLFNLSDEKMDWTIGKLKSYGLKDLIGAHCTGINAVFRIQRELSLDRSHAVVGAVGGGFELGKGINPGSIAK
jgi:7,8-dihydropterin-6-yl-methyl-4-(beta-D-ribofuranosyl)aminobenzene 5'-phosphate synthase